MSTFNTEPVVTLLLFGSIIFEYADSYVAAKCEQTLTI